MNKNISIVGVPLDLGADRRGVDMGPSAIRYAGVVARLEQMGLNIQDRGDISVTRPHRFTETENHKYLDEVVEANTKLAEVVSEIMQEGRFPLVLGGDHSIALGTVAGVARHKKNLGVIWFDAHGDLNTGETSPSGNIHGMPLAASLGFGHERLVNIGGFAPKLQPENVVIIGARDLDRGERELIKRIGLKVFTMHEIDKLGMARVMEEAIAHVSRQTDGVHLSLDLDGLDPHDAPGVGTPVIGGISYREGHLALEMLAEADVLCSAEFVEVNPILDRENATARVAVALMSSAFGDKLL
ncbi:arginase [Brevibacillus composti]|uniref:Arginase n=1 Tax=Brevibacillus composti TaxID=2796470 RepID=A0A7T5ELB0_9BACL|nr:arginase [Brevibacillus composti]QQE74719.1 arginase [Brevibacillus composti]QUO41803.1 arginase [Brevibacillus composti]